MITSKMYKIESIIHYYKFNGLISKSQPVKRSYCGRKLSVNCGYESIPVSDLDEAAYIEAAIAIPYDEMLEHINFYYNSMMDEGEEMFWIDKLCAQYNIEGYLFVIRFRAVERLSNSLFYKKRMEELYNIDDNIKYKNNHNNVKTFVKKQK